MRYVYPFDHKHKKPPMSMKDLLGGKGANLAEMTSVLALPVPHGWKSRPCRSEPAPHLTTFPLRPDPLSRSAK